MNPNENLQSSPQIGDRIMFVDSALGRGVIVAKFEIQEEPCVAVALQRGFWDINKFTYVTTLVALESNVEVI